MHACRFVRPLSRTEYIRGRVPPISPQNSMRALRLVKYGEPEQALEFVDDATAPSKNTLKDTEVYIKVCAASINPIDWKIVIGMLKPLMSLDMPSPIGYDVSGTVEAVGSKVTRFNVGDEVMSRIASLGTFQEYVVADEHYIAKRPSNVTLTESAGIPLAALTALEALESLDIESRNFNKAFVPAGLGGVGHYSTQFLAKIFNIPVATTVSTPKVEKMKALVPGIEVIDYKKEDYTKKLSDIDFVFDTTGDLQNEAKVISENGVVRSIAATPSCEVVSEQFEGVPFYIKAGLKVLNWFETSGMRAKNADYKYFWLTSEGERLERIAKYIEDGKVEPITDSIYEWKDAKAAFTKIKNGGVTGKVIVKVAE